MWNNQPILCLFCLLLLPFDVGMAEDIPPVGESVSGFVTIRLMETQAIEMTDAILQEYILACDRFLEENMKNKPVEIVNLHVRLFHSSVPNGQRRLRHSSFRSLPQDTSTTTLTQILDTTLLLTGALPQSSSTSPEEWEATLPTIVNQNRTGFIATVKDFQTSTNNVDFQTFFEPLTQVEAYSVQQQGSSGQEDGIIPDNKDKRSSSNAAAIAVIVSIVTMAVIAFGICIIKAQQHKRRQNRLSTFPSPKMDALAKDIPPPPSPAVATADLTKEQEEEEEDPAAITHAVAV